MSDPELLQSCITHQVHLLVGLNQQASESLHIPLPLIGSIPYDEEVAEAERRGSAPIDHAAHSLGVGAMRKLAERLEEMG